MRVLSVLPSMGGGERLDHHVGGNVICKAIGSSPLGEAAGWERKAIGTFGALKGLPLMSGGKPFESSEGDERLCLQKK